jgi:type I restriction enzyme M protein
LKSGGRSAVVLPDGSLFGDGVKSRVRQQLLEECNLHTIVRLPNSVFKPYATVGTNLLFFEKGTPTEGIWFFEHRVPQGQKSYSKTKPMLVEHLQPLIEWWGGERRENRIATELSWFVPIQVVKDRNYDLDIKNPNGVHVHQLDVDEMMEKYDLALKERHEILKKLSIELSRLFKHD